MNEDCFVFLSFGKKCFVENVCLLLSLLVLLSFILPLVHPSNKHGIIRRSFAAKFHCDRGCHLRPPKNEFVHKTLRCCTQRNGACGDFCHGVHYIINFFSEAELSSAHSVCWLIWIGMAYDDYDTHLKHIQTSFEAELFSTIITIFQFIQTKMIVIFTEVKIDGFVNEIYNVCHENTVPMCYYDIQYFSSETNYFTLVFLRSGNLDYVYMFTCVLTLLLLFTNILQRVFITFETVNGRQ